MTKQPAQRAGATHAVPLVTQAASGQGKRVTRLARLGHRFVNGVDKSGLAIRRGEDAVFIKPHLARGVTRLEWPLLRPGIEHGIAHAGDVKVTATG